VTQSFTISFRNNKDPQNGTTLPHPPTRIDTQPQQVIPENCGISIYHSSVKVATAPTDYSSLKLNPNHSRNNMR